jgi:Endosomal/lysosomal potassium channel TMEM175
LSGLPPYTGREVLSARRLLLDWLPKKAAKGWELMRSLHRMELFSDAVFAIVITLLILDLRPPDVPHFTFSALSNVGPQALAFVLSFVMVGLYWVAHHNMSLFIKNVDRVLLFALRRRQLQSPLTFWRI